MTRTGLTNLVAWGVATFCIGVFLAPLSSLLLVVAISLGVAWFSRYWAEALGVSAGVAAIFLYNALASPVFLLAAGTVAGAAMVTWRERAGAAVPAAAAPASPAAVSTPRRLIITTLVASFGIFVVDFFASIGFGFSCDADARPGAPGSDRAAWCDALAGQRIYLVILFLPPAVALIGGIYSASRGRAREVLMFVLAGFALVIAVHVPDVIF